MFLCFADECEMTRMSMLLTRFFYKIWFFGACYYYASWVFLGVSPRACLTCSVQHTSPTLARLFSLAHR